jgi:predicted N-acetyltransferase YhbS
VPARTGDHQAIHRLLLGVFHGPTPGEFCAQLDEPGYDPADRLLVKHGERVAAHVRLSRRLVQLDKLHASAARLMDLATAPEYRGLGFASSLVSAAERRASEQGALVGLTRTRAASIFARQGWSVCGRHVFSTAGARQILAQLQATSEGIIPACDDGQASCLFRVPAQPIAVRPLRRIELPAVVRLYDQALCGLSGCPVRSEAYWEWLLGRQACDRIYVAAEGPETLDLAQQVAAILGYVFVKEGRIVELLVAPGRCDLAERLVARVCADASEQDHWQVRLDAPPDNPLHRLCQSAGGQIHEVEQAGGEVFMAKVLQPLRLLSALGETLIARRRAAELPRPLVLGLEVQCGSRTHHARAVEVARLRLVFTGRGMKVVQGPPGRNYLTLRRRDLTPLLLGHRHLPELIEGGRIDASSKLAQQVGAILFPKLPWWYPPLDDLLA